MKCHIHDKDEYNVKSLVFNVARYRGLRGQPEFYRIDTILFFFFFFLQKFCFFFSINKTSFDSFVDVT